MNGWSRNVSINLDFQLQIRLLKFIFPFFLAGTERGKCKNPSQGTDTEIMAIMVIWRIFAYVDLLNQKT